MEDKIKALLQTADNLLVALQDYGWGDISFSFVADQADELRNAIEAVKQGYIDAHRATVE